MNKTKITYVLGTCVIIFSGFILSGSSDKMYMGTEFLGNIRAVMFTTLSFCCFCIIEKNTTISLFADCNTVKLVRIHSRKKALLYDLARIFLIVFILQGCEIFAVFAGTIWYGKKIIAAVLFQYFFMNYIIKLFMILLQFFLETCCMYNLGIVVVLGGFVSLLFEGNILYQKMLGAGSAEKINFYKTLNRLNFVNYISVSRSMELTKNIFVPIFIICGLIGVWIVFLFAYIKKADLIGKKC